MLDIRRRYIRGLVTAVIMVLCITAALIASPFKAEASESGWNAALSSIDVLHDTFTALEGVNKLDKQQIQVLRKQNDDKLKTVNAKVQMIDKAKIDRLKSEADQVQKKYAPLLSEYTELGKKAADARKRKDQKAAVLLDLKRNKLKAAATAARLEIKTKKDALAAARKDMSAKAKVVKDALAPVQTLKKQVTTENKLITASNSIRTAADKRYKAAIKQGNAVTAAAEMALMYKELGKVNASQKKIYKWEEQMSTTIQSGEAKLPK